MNGCKRLLTGALVAVALLATPSAFADDGDREQARAFALQGIEAYEQGRWRESIGFFEQAEQLFSAPQNLIYIARANVKLEQLLVARKAYGRATIQGAADEPESFKGARRVARRELAALEKTIPSVRIDPGDVDGRELYIEVDDRPVGPQQWDRILVDPGSHVVRAGLSSTQTSSVELMVARGDSECVTLALPAEDGGGGGANGGPSLVLPGVFYGVGGAGLLFGAITGIAAISTVSDVESRCADGICPNEDREAVGEADALATAANIGFVTAGIGAAIGTVLLVIELSGDDGGGAEQAHTLQLTAGVGRAALRLRF
jgi:hypothetical protein